MKLGKLKFPGIYRGKVLATDEAESDKLGRIKVEVYPMLIEEGTARELKKQGHDIDGIPLSVMPWAKPAMPLFAGAGDGFGWFAVPKVDSFVFVFFEEGDIYQPVYFAEAQSAIMGLPVSRLTNYPDKAVLRTSGGIEISIDNVSKGVRVDHPSGAYVMIDGDGSIVISGTSVSINP